MPYDSRTSPPLSSRAIPAIRVAEAMHRAGFPESEWATGVAIARRESAWVPELIGAVNPVTRKVDPDNASWDFGLFQISYRWNNHLMEGPKKIGEWDDPDDNTRIAKYLFDESVRRGHEGWRPWHTYTSGNYEVYMDLARAAVAEYKSSLKYREIAAEGVAKVVEKKLPITVSYTGLKIETRDQVGISSINADPADTTHGVVLHYPGAENLVLGDHDTCRKQVQNWDAQHRNQGWVGLGYSFALCHHGILMTGRGLRRQGAHAPGANATHVGILIMIANDKDWTPAQLAGFRDTLEWLRREGVDISDISPHSKWISTSCPGDYTRERIRTGNYTTGVTPSKTGGSFTGGGLTTVRSVEYQQKAVNAAGYTPALKVDDIWGPKTADGVKWLQKKLGVTADALWGSATDAAHQKSLNKKEETPVSTPKKKVTEDGILGKQTISELQRALNEKRF